MSADPFKTLRDRQLEYQASPVVLVDPATGEAGVIRLSGSTLAEATKTEDDLVGDTITFSAPVEVLEIQNDDLENVGTFVVNGIGVVLKPGYGLAPTRFGGVPSAVVTVTGSTKFTMNRYE